VNHLPLSLGQDSEFDATVHGRDGVPTLRDGGDLRIITKDEGTEAGRALACLTFTVEVDGKPVRAQTVTTVRLLVTALHALMGRYGNDGKRQAPATVESLMLDAVKDMPPELVKAMREEVLKLAIHRLGGKLTVSTDDTLTVQALKLHVGFDAKRVAFNFETRREQ